MMGFGGYLQLPKYLEYMARYTSTFVSLVMLLVVSQAYNVSDSLTPLVFGVTSPYHFIQDPLAP